MWSQNIFYKKGGHLQNEKINDVMQERDFITGKELSEAFLALRVGINQPDHPLGLKLSLP